jgi:hypothetical protein
MRSLFLVLSLGLVVTLSAAVPAESRTFVAGHLYVRSNQWGPAPVSRYSVVNGVPSAAVDLTYTNLSSAFAVDSDGAFYGLRWTREGFAFEVSPPNSARVSRRVIVVNPYSTSFNGLLGRSGYIYIGYY